MKKTFLSLLLIFIIFNVFAAQEKVCIYPFDDSLANYLENNFSVYAVKTNVNIKNEDLLKADERIFQYILKQSKADMLLIPDKSNLAGFNLFKLWLYNQSDGRFVKIFESLTQNDSFPEDVVVSLAAFFNTPVEKPITSENESQAKSSYSNLRICSDPQGAELYINEKFSGKTPVVLEEYEVPFVIRLHSEGFSDVVARVEKPGESLDFKMVLREQNAQSLYEDVRNEFYKNFSLLLFSFGFKAALPAFSKVTGTDRALDYIGDGLMAILAGRSAYSLFDYYKGAKQVQP